MVLTDPEISYFLSVLVQKTLGISVDRGQRIAEHFTTLESFTDTDFETVQLVEKNNKKITISEKHRKHLNQVKQYIDHRASMSENWIKFTTYRSINKFVDNVKKLKLDEINMNPFLIRAINLKSPKEVVRFNVYQTVGRSIVTSMGKSLEYMVGNSGARMGERGEWYDVIKEIENSTYWIQVKSGPNNIDKDQISAFNVRFDMTEKKKNNHARLGITYGKRNLDTVSLGLGKKYMTNWDERLLIGHELWDFVSGEKGYHKKVLSWIDEVASQVLDGHSIDEEITKMVTKLTAEFKDRYGDGEDGVKKYLSKVL